MNGNKQQTRWPSSVCKNRSNYYGAPRPHSYTSQGRVRAPGEEWSEWEKHCSWCGKAQPRKKRR